MPASSELIVGCYTPGDYEREAEERLIASVKALGLPHVIRPIENEGSWILNNAACQKYLVRLLDEFPDADFLYCDVDGVVRSDPWPFLRALPLCDVAAYFLPRRGRHYEELLSGTLYLPARPRRRELLTRWVAKNVAQPDVWDQKHLQTLLGEDRTFVCGRLPAEFCCIFDTQRKSTPDIVPVVEHFQASRRYKNRVHARGQGPLVSIICPAYRCERWVGLMVDSILAQTYENWQLIVVDDGSPDRTFDRALQAARGDERVTVVHIDHVGYARAFNHGLSLARGSIIARQDADDVSYPDRLKRQVQELTSSKADFVTCGVTRLTLRGLRKTNNIPGMGPQAYITQPAPGGPASGTIVTWKEIYDDLGGFDPQYEWSADSDWNLRALAEGYLDWHHIGEDLYTYREHPGQMTKRDGGEGLRVHAERLAHYGPTIRFLLEGPPPVVPAAGNRRVVVETCRDKDSPVQIHMDAVAEACGRLGYEVLRWARPRPLPQVEWVFWWGGNVPEWVVQRAMRLGCVPMYMEVGWTLDRYECLQIDPAGCGGLASWAEEPLPYVPDGPLSIKPEGDVLVCLRYDYHPIKADAYTSPFFRSNLDWVRHLLRGTRLPLRFRAHYASLPERTAEVRRVVERAGHVWDESPSFEVAAKSAKAVAIVDSTAGVQALEMGLPVLCYGRQVCRQPGAVYCLENSVKETKRATRDLLEGRCKIDRGAVKALLARIREHQWYLRDKDSFPARLRKEFGL